LQTITKLKTSTINGMIYCQFGRYPIPINQR